MRIVLLGAPGSGKGTQAQRLAQLRGVPQISSGDLLRDAKERGTELGLRAKAAMDAGELVSDQIVLALIRERLSRADAARGFILDGFPRNSAQAEALSEMLGKLGQPIDAVVLMSVDNAILMKRLTGRRTCARCGRIFNIYSAPPTPDMPCIDGSTQHDLKQRSDDTEETIRNRLETYSAQTRPLIDHYERLGLLRTVDAEGDVDAVFARLEHALNASIPPKPQRRAAIRRRTVRKRPTKQAARRLMRRTQAAKKRVIAKPKRARATVKRLKRAVKRRVKRARPRRPK
jgi:adenylate kinase